jgi:hypothetical protein
MRQLSLIALVGVVAIWAGGCATGGDTTAESPTPPETPSAVPVPSSPQAQPANVPSPGAATEPPSPVGTLPPDLISSTDPNQRLQEVQRNRSDPFAIVSTTPIVQVSEDAANQNQPSTPQEPGELAPIPQLVPNAPAVNLPPPPPPTDLARAVKVTGVVQIGSVPYAIVNAPNEASSRYVRVGQLLSNGEVLVKRIEVYQGAEPLVVLEQNGVEVVRAVGEGGAPAAPAPSAPAAVAIAPITQATWR